MTLLGFLDVLERLEWRLGGKRRRPELTAAERRNIEAVVGAWFSQYRAPFIEILRDDKLIASMDEAAETVLNLAMDGSSPRTILRAEKRASVHFKGSLLVPLNRAHVSRAPQSSAAGRDEGVARPRA